MDFLALAICINLLFLFLFFVLMQCVIIKQVEDKPIVKITILDLISIDLATSYESTVVIAIIRNIILDIDFVVPDFLALSFGWIFQVVSITFMLYLSVGVVIRYLIIHCQNIDLFRGHNDEFVRLAIRIVIIIAGITICSIIWHNEKIPNYSVMLKPEWEASRLGRIVEFTLLPLATFINISLRILIYFEKKKLFSRYR